MQPFEPAAPSPQLLMPDGATSASLLQPSKTNLGAVALAVSAVVAACAETLPAAAPRVLAAAPPPCTAKLAPTPITAAVQIEAIDTMRPRFMMDPHSPVPVQVARVSN